MTENSITGGCQCGAIRYSFINELVHPHICHCRMCQKAAGNFFMPLGGVLKAEFELTRGELNWFDSSDLTRRGFCKQCGTPLVFETKSSKYLNITLGSLDNPTDAAPIHQFGIEAKMPWFENLNTLKSSVTEEDELIDQENIAEIRRSNHQHPDHDTRQWPPK